MYIMGHNCYCLQGMEIEDKGKDDANKRFRVWIRFILFHAIQSGLTRKRWFYDLVMPLV